MQPQTFRKLIALSLSPFSLALFGLALCLMIAAARPSRAQTVQPVIVEYRSKASGMFSVANTTPEPMVVLIEPKSFSIGTDGRGSFRPLDASIHLQISAKSVRLMPHQTYYVFYKADADVFPAWFTIYSTFSGLRPGGSVSVRIQLPHTVYLYQTEPIAQGDVHVLGATYSKANHKLTCDVQNMGKALARVQEVRTTGSHTEPALLAGFPLLPGAVRHLEVDWTGKEPPTAMNIEFEHFTLKPPFTVDSSPPAKPPAAGPPASTGTDSIAQGVGTTSSEAPHSGPPTVASVVPPSRE